MTPTSLLTDILRNSRSVSFDKTGGTWPLIIFTAMFKYVILVKFPNHGGIFPCT
uniref:Uncharacterized protein n=1 Tax=Arundo donax TaxID=35708 RepID=A0A0A8ZZC3_ARUDO